MKVKVEAINLGEEKINRNGKPYYWAGLKINGEWRNGFLNPPVSIAVGDEIEIELFEEEYNGRMQKKFKLLGKREQEKAQTDTALTILTAEIGRMKDRLKVIELKLEIEVDDGPEPEPDGYDTCQESPSPKEPLPF